LFSNKKYIQQLLAPPKKKGAKVRDSGLKKEEFLINSMLARDQKQINTAKKICFAQYL